MRKLQHKAITKSFSLLTNADRAKVEEGDFLETSGVFNTLEEIVAMRDFGSKYIRKLGIVDKNPLDFGAYLLATGDEAPLFEDVLLDFGWKSVYTDNSDSLTLYNQEYVRHFVNRRSDSFTDASTTAGSKVFRLAPDGSYVSFYVDTGELDLGGNSVPNRRFWLGYFGWAETTNVPQGLRVLRNILFWVTNQVKQLEDLSVAVISESSEPAVVATDLAALGITNRTFVARENIQTTDFSGFDLIVAAGTGNTITTDDRDHLNGAGKPIFIGYSTSSSGGAFVRQMNLLSAFSSFSTAVSRVIRLVAGENESPWFDDIYEDFIVAHLARSWTAAEAAKIRSWLDNGVPLLIIRPQLDSSSTSYSLPVRLRIATGLERYHSGVTELITYQNESVSFLNGTDVLGQVISRTPRKLGIFREDCATVFTIPFGQSYVGTPIGRHLSSVLSGVANLLVEKGTKDLDDIELKAPVVFAGAMVGETPNDTTPLTPKGKIYLNNAIKFLLGFQLFDTVESHPVIEDADVFRDDRNGQISSGATDWEPDAFKEITLAAVDESYHGARVTSFKYDRNLTQYGGTGWLSGGFLKTGIQTDLDFEIWMQYTRSGGPGAGIAFYANSFISGGTIFKTGYALFVFTDTTRLIHYYTTIEDGVTTQQADSLGWASHGSFPDDVLMNLRIRVIGGTFEMQHWREGRCPPTSWFYSRAISPIEGDCGIAALGDLVTDTEMKVGFFAVRNL